MFPTAITKRMMHNFTTTIITAFRDSFHPRYTNATNDDKPAGKSATNEKNLSLVKLSKRYKLLSNGSAKHFQKIFRFALKQ
jgi:hypothetical protein